MRRHRERRGSGGWEGRSRKKEEQTKKRQRNSQVMNLLPAHTQNPHLTTISHQEVAVYPPSHFFHFRLLPACYLRQSTCQPVHSQFPFPSRPPKVTTTGGVWSSLPSTRLHRPHRRSNMPEYVLSNATTAVKEAPGLASSTVDICRDTVR
jgi:hypothetical protein